MARQGLFYGWVIVAVAVLGIGCSFSVLVLTMTGIFATPIIHELGWTTQQVISGSSIAGIGGVLSAPFIGAFTDRWGVRRVLGVSFFLEVLVLASFKYITADPLGYQLRYLVLALLCMGTTQVVFSRVISAWFNRRLGLALGIALAGVGVGGAFWSLTIQKLIDVYGWRNAYVGMALIVGLFTLPIVVLLVRDTPLSKGQNIDGDAQAASPAEALQQINSGMTLGQAASTRQYWLMILVFMLVGSGLQSVQIHLVPLLISRGNTAQLAAAVQASMALAVIVGRVSSGWFLDRVFAARVAQAYLIAPIIGIAALTIGVSGTPAFVAAMFVGLAVGGESDVTAYLVRRYFGIKQYSRIYGTFFSAYGTASAIGPYLTAWGLQRVAGGSSPEQTAQAYGVVLWAHVATLALAILLLFGYRRYSVEGVEK